MHITLPLSVGQECLDDGAYKHADSAG